MATRMTQDALVTGISNAATRMRIESVRSTSEAGSGHPKANLFDKVAP